MKRLSFAACGQRRVERPLPPQIARSQQSARDTKPAIYFVLDVLKTRKIESNNFSSKRNNVTLKW